MKTTASVWSPWKIQDGPPCGQCKFWRPTFKYRADGEPDGIQCCHAQEQFQDFSCFKLSCPGDWGERNG